jgi:hypothetical protein
MYGLANYFSRQATSIALLVNGGSISLKEMEWNVKQGREVIVIAGSGRLADRIATAIRNPQTEIQEAELSSGKLTVFDLAEPVEGLVELLRQRLNSELSAQS